MALKTYKLNSETADTDTDLIPTLSGVAATCRALEIIAPTAAVVIIKRNDGSNDYGEMSLNLDAGDVVVLDHPIVIPGGHSLVIQSDQTDTAFVANVNEA